MFAIDMFVVLIFVISLTAGCGREPEFNIEDHAKQSFAVLPGRIGIKIKNNAGEWHRVIRKGTLVKVDSLPTAPEGASGGYGSGASGLPKQEGFIYKGPYVESPDRRYMAASIGVRFTDPAPWGFIIIDTQTSKTIAMIKEYDDREDRYYLKALAWSPDSKWVAVMKDSYRMPFFEIGQLFGHGTPYMTYYLDVVNLSGDVVAHTKLSSEIPYSAGWVVWME